MNVSGHVEADDEQPRHYFSIHGPDFETGQWKLMVYKIYFDKINRGDTITPYTREPELYADFESLLARVLELQDVAAASPA